MGPALKDNSMHCYGDYLAWSDGLRYELIDGVAYLMAPAPDIAHQQIAGDIYRQAANLLIGKRCSAFIAPVDVLLPKHAEAGDQVDTVVQPDVFVVCDANKIDRRAIRGAPDWIVEVLSPSTAGHDQIKKRRLYERHRVAEYWLVHPYDRILTVYRLQGDEYGKPEIFELKGETIVGIVPEIVIEWDQLVARLPIGY